MELKTQDYISLTFNGEDYKLFLGNYQFLKQLEKLQETSKFNEIYKLVFGENLYNEILQEFTDEESCHQELNKFLAKEYFPRLIHEIVKENTERLDALMESL